ncbi:amino acid kinase [Listeria floridensis FSL S10-1187]|uniref:Carbamate kinase n=1 Tax=Listeria floridensis FSL S10-1187 TaxID=1265817 RepID=A0ABN0RDG4_9LIST|nr:carbamate kinase [Listeria floridensis]EUJ28814.1 amino acid kinase [Listeria floridensis FSL S10-1187]
MKKRKVVVALGGNAILSNDASAEAQQKALEQTAEHLVEFVLHDDDLVISHGNGPQVGNLLLQQQAGNSEKNPALPLDSCVAMTQGSIGYWMQNAFDNVFHKHQLEKETVSLITQVIVDQEDPAFRNPTKPIGPFLSKEEALTEEAETGAVFIEDAGRGYRKVVPSPMPLYIKEHVAIRQLIENGVITISAGGGGISVVDQDGKFTGVEAVIDKDFASLRLAEMIEADLFVILTGVDHVFVNFNKPDQQKLEHVTVSELERWRAENQFAAGSMLPKIEAAMAFVKNRPSAKAVITSLENIGDFLKNGTGTVITAK